MSKPTENNTSSSTLETSLVNLTKRMDLGRVDYRNAMVLHCGMCNTIWGDSLEVCGEVKQLNCIICLRVTKDVVVKDELEFRLEGQMAGSTYKALHCSGCQCFVGVVPYSTPKNLSALRNLFLLQKENISCYSLRTGTMVKASSLHFDQSSVDESIKELNREMRVLDESFTATEKRLKEEYYGKEG
ncbi:protein Mis18-beta [Anguilla rostrata]|uniref:Mis18 domain-containing protein n=1 Tax=Anguilla anguilla TaxID=7936 RepID=A0A0E9WM99_ANGAN|nr:protein Mis18-beta [Anguilla anguilla]KAG5857860.1 hypothetical protein ANANG_G00023880 [Anguilla anguilla]